jgi:hypothetical protein
MLRDWLGWPTKRNPQGVWSFYVVRRRRAWWDLKGTQYPEWRFEFAHPLGDDLGTLEFPLPPVGDSQTYARAQPFTIVS